MTNQDAEKPGIHLVVPRLSDPRVMVAVAQTLWVVLGATTYYFNRDPFRLGVTVGTACGLDMLIAFIWRREILVPISAYLTAMSIGILLESYDWRIYAVAAAWGIPLEIPGAEQGRPFLQPVEFRPGDGAVALPAHRDHRARFAMGGRLPHCRGDHRLGPLDDEMHSPAGTGPLLDRRLRPHEPAADGAGQGGLIFALGPMTGSEFALFTFVMLPDPKASPPTRNGRIAWGLSIAVLDGIMRFYEIRYSPFYSLFIHCALLPVFRWAAARGGLREAEHRRYAKIPLGVERT